MFKVNDGLKKDIESKIPDTDSNLEKAMHIYKNLASKLEYGMDYYLDPKNPEVVEKYNNIKNIENVDGLENNEVVCSTFSAIYLQLLKDEGIINQEVYDETIQMNMPMEDEEHFEPATHVALEGLEIDGCVFEIDATHGIIGSSDLLSAKYGENCFTGWKLVATNEQEGSDPQKQFDDAQKKFEDLQEQVCADYSEIKEIEKAYRNTKQQEGSIKELPIEQRFPMFLEALKDTPEYSVQSLNHINRLKHLYFKDEEHSAIKSTTKVQVQYVKDVENDEYRCILAFNKNGYTNVKGQENFDSLECYDISLKNRRVESCSREELLQKIEEQTYLQRKQQGGYEKLNPIKLLREGYDPANTEGLNQ